MLAALWHRLGDRDDWLLVFDDCPNPDLVRAVLPTLASGRVVVTSRHQAWGHVGRTVPVDLLTQDQSVALLLQSSGTRISDPPLSSPRSSAACPWRWYRQRRTSTRPV